MNKESVETKLNQLKTDLGTLLSDFRNNIDEALNSGNRIYEP